ncbi:MAG: DUF2203 family protein [Verrucomicrobia bacterium]|nr:MAG: DUF2203 family protein [Verrucomicrobiota bacterium]
MSPPEPLRFRRHYTVAEANALLPQVRAWLREIREIVTLLSHLGERVDRWIDSGRDAGGAEVEHLVRRWVQAAQLSDELGRREILVKDLERGLVDFPAFVGGREVFLCWEEGEEEVRFWHDLDAGYAGRQAVE